MQLLNLVLFSESNKEEPDAYQDMKEILSKYYTMFEPNVQTFFYKYKENLESDYKLDGNVLLIKGTESFIPGILEKTLKAFEFIKDKHFDYLVRSNISTIINFELLVKELSKNPINFYGGGSIMNLQWAGGGITDSTWYGTLFVCGTSIILTKSAVNFIVDNQHLIKKEIIDDVSLAILIREYKKDIIPQEIDRKLYSNTPCFFKNNGTGGFDLKSLFEYVAEKKEIIFYRNKCNNSRKVDVIQMKIIVDILMEKYIYKI